MLFSNRDLRKIIIPLLIEQFFAVLVGMADTVMVSIAGESAVSGVSLVNTFNLFIIYLFTALCAGGAIVIAQLLGKKDYEKAMQAGKQLYYVVFVFATIISVAMLIFRRQILGLIFGKIELEVMQNALNYSLYTSISFIFLALYNAGASFYRAQGNTKISMSTSLVMNIINVCGNAILIYGFKMGAVGAAIATLFANVFGAGFITFRACRKKQDLYIDKLFKYKPNLNLIKNICGIGIPNGLENGMFQFGKIITLSLISTFGTAQIAANATGNTLASLQYACGNALGLAMTAVIGRCIGAGQKEQAKHYAKKLTGITYACVITVSAILCLFSKTFVGFFNLSPTATKISQDIVYAHSIFICTIWPVAFTLPNSFRAASDVRFTMIIAIASMWTLRVGLSFVFAIYFDMGVMSVWYAMFCDWIFRFIIFGTRYLSGKWLTKYKVESKDVVSLKKQIS